MAASSLFAQIKVHRFTILSMEYDLNSLELVVKDF
jgi:hypothetical protein